MNHALVHHAVRHRAVEQPDSVALVEGDRQLTYSELTRHANDVATSLLTAGAAPGAIVAVNLSRGIDLVVTMLATLESGAAYSVLDHAWPASRTRTVLDQLSPAVIVDRRWWEQHGCVARPTTPSATGADDLTPDAACCVFFTSGTTGVPKGSVSPHAALTSLLDDPTLRLFDHGTVLLSTAAVPWDAFALEIWGVLLAGGTVVFANEPYPQPSTVRRAVTEHRTNTIWLTSALFNVLVDEDVECLSGMHTVLTGGEAMSPRHARRFLDAHPNSVLLNGYGPVESAIFATMHQVAPGDLDETDVPIGRPVGGREIVVLRDDTRCAPEDVGEIHIGGAGLALGYLGDDNETARRFVQATVDGAPTRLYRTGDLGMVDSSGRLHFRGRADRQVKIRGHRVDPRHVEDVAREALAVDSVVVPVPVPVPVPAADEAEQVDRLALFCVGDQQVPPDWAREKLGELLPDYLVPHQVLTVPAFPATENGKTDRQALIDLVDRTGQQPSCEEPGEPVANRPTAATGNPVADRIAQVYAELLGGEDQPGASIIERGGTSLDMVRASARLGSRFGVAVPLDRLVADSSPAAVASWIEDRPSMSEDPVDGGSQEVRLPTLVADTWLRELATPDNATGNCVMLWRIAGEVQVDVLRAALQDVHDRHESLRAAYTYDEVPVALPDQGWAEVDLAVDHGSRDTVLAELYEPFELEDGEVWRGVVSPGADVTLLGIAVHHVAFDGWSEALLAADLSTAYRARLAGTEPEFEEAAPTLRQISADCARQSAQRDSAEQIAYWTELLRDVPDLVFPAPSRDSVASPVDSRLPTERWAACDHLGRTHGTTAFPVLLAVYAGALHAVTGQADFAVGFPLAQRGTALTSAAVTCLTSTLCVRPPAMPVRDAVPALAHQVRLAMRNSLVSFPEVVRRLGRAGGAHADPFRTVFALQDNLTPQLDVPGWTSSYVRTDHHTAVAGLSAEVLPVDDSAVLHLTYQPDFVDRATVTAVATAFDELLQEIPAAGSPRRSRR